MFNLILMLILIAGAINWFIIGVFQFDIIAGLFGSQSVFLSRFVYTLIGIAGLYILLLLGIKKGNLDFRRKDCKTQKQIKPKDKDIK